VNKERSKQDAPAAKAEAPAVKVSLPVHSSSSAAFAAALLPWSD